ncbi:MAG: ATP-grasp domain-containing protein [Desulfobacterales bacterium]|nr:ATP-grasp domain-containing protein [Desulfobacterales bacterium]MDD4073714.1 ATP-grasp domain-containing protein [Desulfobacterales bacterium]MDD4393470.1 ATP-grasp domain-containing protein [Desulfobacterales bacterium]
MSDKRVLIVGTTPDYVVRIFNKRPDRVCFLMDQAYRWDFTLNAADPDYLCFTDLEQFDFAERSIRKHFQRFGITPDGIACFDCESLLLAGFLAVNMGLPFPELQAIALARDKFKARTIWKQAGIFSPLAALSSLLDETLTFFRTTGAQDVVLKPISASGSELVFHCTTESEVKTDVNIMIESLAERQANRLFKSVCIEDSDLPVSDPCKTWIVEQFVSGPEFSCDFILEDNRIYLIRTTEKVMAPNQTFGSVLAYIVPPSYPEGFSPDQLPDVLKTAATSLGFTRGYFMADLIIHNDRPVIIEMTPRPGGDSIPDLIEAATGFDIIGAYLDLVCAKLKLPVRVPRPDKTVASINLYAESDGLIAHLDANRIHSLPWVKSVHLKKEAGDIITFPPQDYDNRLIGYCIISLPEDEDMNCIAKTLMSHVNIITNKSYQWTTSSDNV